MRRAFLCYAAALMLVTPVDAKNPLQAKSPIKSLRLSEIYLYAPSVEPGYVLHGSGLFRADFVVNYKGLDFMQVTSRRGGKRGERTHEGIDIAAPYGADIVYLGFDGESALARTGFQENGCGKYVLLEREDVTTLFCHFSDIAVEDGTTVKAETLIGHVGASGNAKGSHLHYEKHDKKRSVQLERVASLR